VSSLSTAEAFSFFTEKFPFFVNEWFQLSYVNIHGIRVFHLLFTSPLFPFALFLVRLVSGLSSYEVASFDEGPLGMFPPGCISPLLECGGDCIPSEDAKV